jgi:hypothetical protein
MTTKCDTVISVYSCWCRQHWHCVITNSTYGSCSELRHSSWMLASLEAAPHFISWQSRKTNAGGLWQMTYFFVLIPLLLPPMSLSLSLSHCHSLFSRIFKKTWIYFELMIYDKYRGKNTGPQCVKMQYGGDCTKTGEGYVVSSSVDCAWGPDWNSCYCSCCCHLHCCCGGLECQW